MLRFLSYLAIACLCVFLPARSSAQHTVGYTATADDVTFVFDLAHFWVGIDSEEGFPVDLLSLTSIDSVYAAGLFSEWAIRSDTYRLTPSADRTVWTLTQKKNELSPFGETQPFKFVIHATIKKQKHIFWSEPSESADNRVEDAEGNTNLVLYISRQVPPLPAEAHAPTYTSAPAKPDGGYLIGGTIAGIGNLPVYLYKGYGTSSKGDSTIANAGTFYFTGNVSEPDVYTVRIGEMMRPIPLLLENTAVSIKGDIHELADAAIQGGAAESERQAFSKKQEAAYAKMSKMALAAQKAEESGKAAKAKRYSEKTDAMWAANQAQNRAYIRSHPASLVSLLEISNQADELGPKKTLELLSGMDAATQKHARAETIRTSCAQADAVAVEKQAPAFAQNSPENVAIALASYRGKYVLVDFWASWCGPCRAENPNVVKAYGEYHPKGFEILGVSLDNNRDAWLAAIAKDNLPWAHVSDLKGWQNEVAQLYSVRSIPQNFLLDPQGKIIAVNLRGAALEAKLAEIFP